MVIILYECIKFCWNTCNRIQNLPVSKILENVEQQHQPLNDIHHKLKVLIRVKMQINIIFRKILLVSP